MKSSEIAKFADVSVRTLRHYHDLGLIPEPPRHENGYRDYSALDLARLLRIKRLSALGFSLADIKGMLDAEDGNQSESAGNAGSAECSNESPANTPDTLEDRALEQLDRELQLRIEQLQRQRLEIAALRREKLDPSLPLRFAQLVKRLYGTAVENGTADLTDYNSAALTVAGHLYDEADLEELERFTNKVEELGLLDDLHALEHRMGQLPADATEGQKAELVEDAMDLLRPVLPCFDLENWEGEAEDIEWNLLDSLLAASVNEAQADVNRMIDEAIISELRSLSH